MADYVVDFPNGRCEYDGPYGVGWTSTENALLPKRLNAQYRYDRVRPGYAPDRVEAYVKEVARLENGVVVKVAEYKCTQPPGTIF